MPKKKSSDSIAINPSSNVLTPKMLDDAISAAARRGVSSNSTFVYTGTGILNVNEHFDDFKKTREFNKQRFINYCHKGTILEHATSGVKWEVLGVEDVEKEEESFFFTVVTIKKKLVNIRSLNKSTQKKPMQKSVDVEMFYMYDVVEVPDTVKVLWGDPKDNPPRKPHHSK